MKDWVVERSRHGPFRARSIAGFLTVLSILLACSGSGDGGTTAPSDPPMLATQVVVDTGDPSQLASYVMRQINALDMDAINDLLPSEYRSVGYGLRRGFTYLPLPLPPGVSLGEEPDEWTFTEHETLVIARLAELPVITIVMRRQPDGSLQLDPGNCAYQRSLAFREDPNPEAWNAQAVPREWHADSAQRNTISAVLTDLTDCVLADQSNVEVSFTWLLKHGAAASITVSEAYWSTGSQTGPAEVVWTTGYLEGRTLSFPQAIGGDETATFSAYNATFRLQGASLGPDLMMHLPEVGLDVPGEDPVAVGVSYFLPEAPFPAVEIESR
jgi:hypothetical protein